MLRFRNVFGSSNLKGCVCSDLYDFADVEKEHPTNKSYEISISSIYKSK